MTELMDIRRNEELGYYEICTQINEPGGETYWQPAGEYYARNRIPFPKELRNYTLLNLLLMEGWNPPIRQYREDEKA